MTDIVDMKKDGKLVYPKTHYTAIQGSPPRSFISISLHDGLKIEINKVGECNQIVLSGNPTSTFDSGEKPLGVIIPTEFRPEGLQIMSCLALNGSTPLWDSHYVLYLNSSGNVYIYTTGCDNTGISFYGSNVYIQKFS